MIVIGFTGPAGAGKDTAARLLADHLVNDRGLKVRIQAWANLLKIAAARGVGFHGTDEECIEFCDAIKQGGSVLTIGPNGIEQTHISGRKWLEKFGTEGGRDVYGQDHWIDLALPAPDHPRAALWRASAGFPNVVIDTTTRFPNEAARIRQWGGQVWRVERPEADLRAAVTGHPSRAGIPAETCEAVIVNDGSLEELGENLRGTFLTAELAGDITVPV